MKKGTKLFLGGFALLLGAAVLTGCTQSFCSTNDKANMLYAFDGGITAYYAADDANKPAEAEALDGFDNIYITYSIDNSPKLKEIHSNALGNNIACPTETYWKTFDVVVLKHALAGEYNKTLTSYSDVTVDQVATALKEFGYFKFTDSNPDHVKEKQKKLWANWDLYDQEVRSLVAIDNCPSKDFVTLYQRTMNQNIAAYRSCLAITKGDYGYYNGKPVTMEAKSYKYGWQKGLFEGLLIWPIGALTDAIVGGLTTPKLSIESGIPQILAILIVTVIVRGLMLAVTMKQTTANAKMQGLQPEIAKIQAKYPNANTNQYEKQRMAEETSKLYKKHKINPLSSLLVMIVQFPVFICVWGALQGSAALSSGTFLGLRLSDTISSMLFNKANWASATFNRGVITALVLFVLMSAVQTVAMLLPQWIQKSKAKKIAKLGRNPAKKDQDNKMKWFTYIMLAMIIFMGFSLASAMGVYWLVGALFSIAQTLITNAIGNKKKKSK